MDSALTFCINIYADRRTGELRGYFGTPESYASRPLTIEEIQRAIAGINYAKDYLQRQQADPSSHSHRPSLSTKARRESDVRVCERCKDDGIADEPASYVATNPPGWFLCAEHATFALIAGWRPRAL